MGTFHGVIITLVGFGRGEGEGVENEDARMENGLVKSATRVI